MNAVVAPVRAILSTTPTRWQQLVSTLPVDLLTRPPVAGEWSALDCLQHLLDAERVNFPVRFQAFLAGQDLEAFNPHHHSGPAAQTPEQLAGAFARHRQESLALLTHVTDDDLRRTAQHPELGAVTLAEMLQTWAAHDLNHTMQGERALMHPFMHGCGPWRPFFRLTRLVSWTKRQYPARARNTDARVQRDMHPARLVGQILTAVHVD